MAEYTFKNGKLMSPEDAVALPHEGPPRRIEQLARLEGTQATADTREKGSRK